MNPLRRAVLAWTVLIGLVVAPGGLAASQRIVAIGDIHGAYDNFVEILQKVGLVDQQLDWTGGDTILVQTGDFTDRGPQVREAMDLLLDLQEKAPRDGGRVIVLMGNHEAMNIMGHVTDVSPEAYAGFVDKKSEKRRNRAYKEHQRLVKRRATQFGQPAPAFGPEEERAWMEAHPLGWVEYLAAMSETGRYGKWLRSLPVTVRVGDTLFIHAGIPPDLADLELEEINRGVQDDILEFERLERYVLEQQVALPFYSWRQMQESATEEFNLRSQRAVEKDFITESEREHVLRLAEFVESGGGALTKGDGPLWYRGFARLEDEPAAELVEALVERHRVTSLASGHTPQREGSIQNRFDRLFLIDTGMLTSVYHGSPSALEIRDGTFTAIYLEGRELLADHSIATEPESATSTVPTVD